MELRVLEMINNYPEGVAGSYAKGKYSVLGYFDAMDVDIDSEAVYRGEGSVRFSSWTERSRAVMNKITGDAKVIDLCLAFEREKKQKESTFWNDDSFAFLGISILRTEKITDIMNMVKEENRKDDRMAYYSYEHCEVLVVYHTNSYKEIVERVRELREAFHAIKTYTIFAVPEELLINKSLLEQKMSTVGEMEMVSVRLNATMNNPQKVGKFIQLLRTAMKKKSGSEPEISVREVLGDHDLLIEFDNVPLADILVLYNMKDGLLHHSSDDYRAAFHNVETHFLLPKEEDRDKMTAVPGDSSSLPEDNNSGTGEEQDNDEDKNSDTEKDPDKEEDIRWTKENIQDLIGMYHSKALQSEEALQSYIVCMVKLLNGLMQIRTSRLHIYERTILFAPMKIFMRYFMEQVRHAVEDNTDAREKNDVVQDIENAVFRVSDIYENVLNGTANIDKQMFMSLPMNSSIYELSPRLYAHYSGMIREMRYLFDPENQYAVFLNPTLKRVLKEEILFRKREKNGKVVVVDIPVGMMDYYDYLPLCLIHELFHVLTFKERNRKMRAIMLSTAISPQISFMIFQGVQFSSDVNIDMEIKQKLIVEWLASTREDFICIEKEDDASRNLYAKRICDRVALNLQTDLYQIENRVFRDIRAAAGDTIVGYQGCADLERELSYPAMMNHAAYIRKNVRMILSGHKVSYLIRKLMYLFKETYADVASLVVVPELKASYSSAFEHAVQFRIGSEDMDSDDIRRLRQRLVEIVMATDKSELITRGKFNSNGIQKYREIVYELHTNEKKSVKSAKFGQNALQTIDDRVIINSSFIQAYLEYLYTCKMLLSKRISDFNDDEKIHWELLKSKTMTGKEHGLIELYYTKESK